MRASYVSIRLLFSCFSIRLIGYRHFSGTVGATNVLRIQGFLRPSPPRLTCYIANDVFARISRLPATKPQKRNSTIPQRLSGCVYVPMSTGTRSDIIIVKKNDIVSAEVFPLGLFAPSRSIRIPLPISSFYPARKDRRRPSTPRTRPFKKSRKNAFNTIPKKTLPQSPCKKIKRKVKTKNQLYKS